MLEQSVQGRGNAFSIGAQVAQVVAHEGKIGFSGLYFLDGANPLDGLVLKDIASQAVDCIGWIDNHTAVE